MLYEKVLVILDELYTNKPETLIEEKLNIYGALVYCYTVAGAYEKALGFNKDLLLLNVLEYGEIHPTTINTMLSELKILGKMRMTATIIEQRNALRQVIAAKLSDFLTLKRDNEDD